RRPAEEILPRPARRTKGAVGRAGLPAADDRRPAARARSAGRHGAVSMLPGFTRLLLRLTDPALREFVAGDMEESFPSVAAAAGDARARSWSRRQAAAAVAQHPWRPAARVRHRGDGVMRTLLQDLRYGARMVRRQPTFSLVVVLTLALAIGANTVIFSFANILLLRPLPLKDPGTLGWVF